MPQSNQPTALLKHIALPFLLLATLSIATICIFVNIGNWIVVSDPLPQSLDIIFTFGGEDARDFYSEKLTKKYPTALWITSGSYKHQYVRKLIAAGFDSSRIIVVDTCKNTLSEIDFLGQWVLEYKKLHGIQRPLRVGLVSGPYHMRRIKIMAKVRIPLRDASLSMLPVPFESYSIPRDAYKHWWKDPVLKGLAPSEFKKILFFIFFRQ